MGKEREGLDSDLSELEEALSIKRENDSEK